MKLSKILLILFVSVSVLSCKKDDDSKTSYTLNNANLAGDYDITYLKADVDQVVEINGVPVTSTIRAVGSVFQATVSFTENGTYTASGNYLLTTTVTAGGNSETDEEIITLDDSGTYSVDANSETISLSGATDIGDGTYEVTLFNEDEIRFVLEDSYSDTDGNTTDIRSEYRFRRK